MRGSSFVCPNCGCTNKVIRVGSPYQPKTQSYHSNGFEHTKTLLRAELEPPKGKLGSLIWFLRGNHYTPPPAAARTIRVEMIDTRNKKIVLNEFDPRIEFDILCDIARMIQAGHDWTRDNLTRYTRITENKSRLYVAEFKRMGYLEVSDNNRSTLTPTGKLFLRGILASVPSPI